MRTLNAKWAGKCVGCGQLFAAGASIAWTGEAYHPACFDGLMAEQKRQDAEDAEFQRAHIARTQAGLNIKSMADGEEIMVTGAPNYEMARAEANAVICSIRAAGGKAHLVVKTKNGKRYVGRTVVTYYGMSNLGHHEGWAFRYAVEAPMGSACD